METVGDKATTIRPVVQGNKPELGKALRFLGEAIAARSRVAAPDDPMLRAWLARMARWQEELHDRVVVTE